MAREHHTNSGYLRWLLRVAGPYDARRLANVTSGCPQWNPSDFALLHAREIAASIIADEPQPDDAAAVWK